MRYFLKIFLIVSFFCIQAVAPQHRIEPLSIDKRDISAQQRGAGVFFNYCSSCHSLKQIRYADIARDLKILEADGSIDKQAIMLYLNHVSDDPYSAVLTSLDSALAEQWFGKVPPDLSLVTRSRSPSWVAAYLKSFRLDNSRPWGVNNTILPNTAMPHVLIDRQGQDSSGALLEPNQNYDNLVHDLVSFLTYVGEPRALERTIMGKYVLLFTALMIVVSYLYYQSVWADIKKRDD
jgi:ubiquinol-cytochrome c reductase cytochrome c1 subunit